MMKLNVLIGTILLGAVLAIQAAPSIYVSNGDALLQYHASSGALLGTVGFLSGLQHRFGQRRTERWP